MVLNAIADMMVVQRTDIVKQICLDFKPTDDYFETRLNGTEGRILRKSTV